MPWPAGRLRHTGRGARPTIGVGIPRDRRHTRTRCHRIHQGVTWTATLDGPRVRRELPGRGAKRPIGANLTEYQIVQGAGRWGAVHEQA